MLAIFEKIDSFKEVLYLVVVVGAKATAEAKRAKKTAKDFIFTLMMFKL